MPWSIPAGRQAPVWPELLIISQPGPQSKETWNANEGKLRIQNKNWAFAETGNYAPRIRPIQASSVAKTYQREATGHWAGRGCT
jgi:hypothetical protein